MMSSVCIPRPQYLGVESSELRMFLFESTIYSTNNYTVHNYSIFTYVYSATILLHPLANSFCLRMVKQVIYIVKHMLYCNYQVILLHLSVIVSFEVRKARSVIEIP